MTDVMKKLRATTQIGEDCKCTRFKYFQIISVEEWKRIISNFNG